MHLLQTVAKHWAIDFMQQFRLYLHNQVWPDTQNADVEGRMMDLAQRQAIYHGCYTFVIAVWNYVGCVQQPLLLQPAHRTAPLVSPYDCSSEDGLEESVPSLNLEVAAEELLRYPFHLRGALRGIRIDNELHILLLFIHDKDRKNRLEDTLSDPKEPDQRDASVKS